MAAYAATVSLMHILDLIQNHPSPPISLDKQQVDSLTQVVTFLQEFLEVYVSPFSYSDEADPLEMRIAEAVYAAEDVIESYIVDSIHLAAAAEATSTKHGDDDVDNIKQAAAAAAAAAQERYSPCLMRECFTFLQEFLECYISPFSNNDEANLSEIGIAESAATTTEHDDDDMDSIHLAAVAAAAHLENEQIRYINFYQGLQKVIEAMDLIKKEAMGVVTEKKAGVDAEVQKNVSADGGSKSSSIESTKEMVGFDDELLQLKEMLVRGDFNCQVIPIVGMGGIGKTALARNVFAGKLIQEHFDICLWATISQDHNIKQTLTQVLSQVKVNLNGESVARLGEELYKYLFGRRYLVVLDDMWSIDVWKKMRIFFPDCGNGSRVIVTTRITNLAANLTNSSNILCMSFLNEVDSWTLFSKTVFGSEGSVPHLELREIGEKIVGKCKGLPLSIAVIGGLLARSERTERYWEYVEKNLSSIVNLENEEYCLRVLKLSYNHLPAYLKPCFLYMGVFNEDSEIKISTIIKLWVSEGFVKPKRKKSLERVAREYLQELVDRNLISSYELESLAFDGCGELGSVGMCKMHDLVRDLSLREAQKQRFYYIYNKQHDIPSSHRHIVIPKHTGGIDSPEIMLESLSNPRSCVCHDGYAQLFQNFRLLRTLHAHIGKYVSYPMYSQKDVFGLVNSRLLAIAVGGDRWLHSSISRLWSLHTLLIYSEFELEGPVEFWNMHQLKHVEFTFRRLRLQLPPNTENNIVIMENMHTLFGVVDFHLNENVVRRMPNLRILDVDYEKLMNRKVHCLSYLQRLSKLESFRCSIKGVSGENLQRICFPQSLKQILFIEHSLYPQIELEDVLQKIGWLPFVEELGIERGFFGRGEWETSEGQFPKLKTLELYRCRNLKKWTAWDSSSLFPLLQKLILQGLRELEEIPSEIGEISTLKSIELTSCSKSAVVSAKKIVEEREDLYGEDQLSVRVRATVLNEALLKSLASPKFLVE